MSWDDHLKENGMTYWEHWRFATSHACRCVIAAYKLAIHAFCPWIWQHAGRKLVGRMLRDFDGLDNNH